MKRFSLMVPLSAILVGGTIVGALAIPVSSASASSRAGHASWGLMASHASSGVMGHSSLVARSALTINEAQHQVNLYLNQYGNSHLVIDEILEFQRNFYAIVKDTSTGHGAFEVLVNRSSGLVFPEYGPAMMWNTEYGMMRGGMMGSRYPSGRMTISAVNAAGSARQWLHQHLRGTVAETPDQFPGYYTIHLRRNGVITGMLSINGYTGQIWYHTWHGKFIQIKKVNG